RIAVATRAQPDWTGAVRAGVECALDIFADDPRLLALTAVDVLRVDGEGGSRYDDAVDRLAAALRQGRAHCRWGDVLPELTERILTGGTLSLLAQRAAEGGAGDVRRLAPEIVYFFLVPYLDVDAALCVSAGAGTSPQPPSAD